MERAWSTRTHEHVREACESGSAMIDKLAKLSGQVYSVAHAFGAFAGELPLTEYGTSEGVPNRLYFVPHARALIFYKSFKAGMLVGVEQGQGFVIARLGGPTSNKWSAPAFVRISGVEFGFVAGMDRAETLVGVLSERALESLIEGGAKFNMSTNWNFEITPLEDNKDGGASAIWIFNNDFTSASISKGIMADVAVQGTRIYFDSYWNEHCYGTDDAASILRGSVPAPPELNVMTDRLMSCCSPQLAGIREPLRPSMFGPEVKAAVTGQQGGAAATTTTTTTTVPVTNMETPLAAGVR